MECMSNDEALQLAPGDKVAFGDENIQLRRVIKVVKQPNGVVLVYTAGGDMPHVAEAKDVF
jgi:hypothetical protein